MEFALLNQALEARQAAQSDRSGFIPDSIPDGVVFASGLDDVVATLRFASSQGVPVVTRGAGSGLAGGSSASQGEIVLDLSQMNEIVSLDPDEQIAIVQPGVMNSAVSEAAAPHGLFYAPDPASMTYCSIGGNIATNAGGMRCAKYGVTRESVLGLTAVLADGTVLHTGGQTIKRVSGYDLTGLLIGSEGTLAVVTEAILRLRPLSEQLHTLVAYFPDMASAARCSAHIVRSGATPTILELMDGKTLSAVDDALGTEYSARGNAFLLTQTDGMGAQAEIDAIAQIVREYASDVSLASAEADAQALLTARREAIPSIGRRGNAFVGDVGVPRKHLGQMVEAIEKIGPATGTDIYIIGHAGDGNLHPILVLGPDESIDEGMPKKAMDEMFWAAHRLGGTLTGEHGIGVLKRDWLEPEVGAVGLGLMAGIKSAFDPQGILNPGKAIEPRRSD